MITRLLSELLQGEGRGGEGRRHTADEAPTSSLPPLPPAAALPLPLPLPLSRSLAPSLADCCDGVQPCHCHCHCHPRGAGLCLYLYLCRVCSLFSACRLQPTGKVRQSLPSGPSGKAARRAAAWQPNQRANRIETPTDPEEKRGRSDGHSDKL